MGRGGQSGGGVLSVAPRPRRTASDIAPDPQAILYGDFSTARSISEVEVEARRLGMRLTAFREMSEVGADSKGAGRYLETLFSLSRQLQSSANRDELKALLLDEVKGERADHAVLTRIFDKYGPADQPAPLQRFIAHVDQQAYALRRSDLRGSQKTKGPVQNLAREFLDQVGLPSTGPIFDGLWAYLVVSSRE